ncbi:putative tubulin/FtsZ, GTPase domain superfamily [Helianthus annuus]|nr:putative tubulin/FtsZ, GTPase domain superfamily [Helianthus annuus]KAJ0888362.1 putative tubulin/FtsZ, GTPase domain superfamily [Helianthus annuus]
MFAAEDGSIPATFQAASDSNNDEGKSDTSSELGEPINLKAASDSNNDEGKSDTSSELGEPINLKVMGISVSSVCISVHIGQAGIQVGNSRWKLYCLEHYAVILTNVSMVDSTL